MLQMKSLVRSTGVARPHVARSLGLTDNVLGSVKNTRKALTTTAQLRRPTNVGGLGLAAEDAQIGEQAPEPLTIDGIKARRAKAGKLIAGTAAYSDSDMFKSPVRHVSRVPKRSPDDIY